jgi:hypothetical protein
MLGIYQEYVRNHHYSLQVLAEYKQKPEFNSLVRRYEEKSICEGRSLEIFLTYPMHQVMQIYHYANVFAWVSAPSNLISNCLDCQPLVDCFSL